MIDPAKVDALIADIDVRVERQLELIFANAELEALRGAWTRLGWLVEQLPAGEAFKLWILPAGKQELVEMARRWRDGEPEADVPLRRSVATAAAAMSVMLLDEPVGGSEGDLLELEYLGALAASLHAVVFANAAPSLVALVESDGYRVFREREAAWDVLLVAGDVKYDGVSLGALAPVVAKLFETFAAYRWWPYPERDEGGVSLNIRPGSEVTRHSETEAAQLADSGIMALTGSASHVRLLHLHTARKQPPPGDDEGHNRALASTTVPYRLLLNRFIDRMQRIGADYFASHAPALEFMPLQIRLYKSFDEHSKDASAEHESFGDKPIRSVKADLEELGATHARVLVMLKLRFRTTIAAANVVDFPVVSRRARIQLAKD